MGVKWEENQLPRHGRSGSDIVGQKRFIQVLGHKRVDNGVGIARTATKIVKWTPTVPPRFTDCAAVNQSQFLGRNRIFSHFEVLFLVIKLPLKCSVVIQEGFSGTSIIRPVKKAIKDTKNSDKSNEGY